MKNVLGKTQAEVKEKLAKAIADNQQLDVTKTNNYTVATWLTAWYEVYAEPRLRPNTKLYYQNYINNHIIPEIGSIKLEKLTTIQIQRFYNSLQKSGRIQRNNQVELKDKSLSPRVVRGVHTLLGNCLEQAVGDVTKIFLKKWQHRTIKSRPVLPRPIQIYPRVGRRVGHTRTRKTNTPKKC